MAVYVVDKAATIQVYNNLCSISFVKNTGEISRLRIPDLFKYVSSGSGAAMNVNGTGKSFLNNLRFVPSSGTTFDTNTLTTPVSPATKVATCKFPISSDWGNGVDPKAGTLAIIECAWDTSAITMFGAGSYIKQTWVITSYQVHVHLKIYRPNRPAGATGTIKDVLWAWVLNSFNVNHVWQYRRRTGSGVAAWADQLASGSAALSHTHWSQIKRRLTSVSSKYHDHYIGFGQQRSNGDNTSGDGLFWSSFNLTREDVANYWLGVPGSGTAEADETDAINCFLGKFNWNWTGTNLADSSQSSPSFTNGRTSQFLLMAQRGDKLATAVAQEHSYLESRLADEFDEAWIDYTNPARHDVDLKGSVGGQPRTKVHEGTAASPFFNHEMGWYEVTSGGKNNALVSLARERNLLADGTSNPSSFYRTVLCLKSYGTVASAECLGTKAPTLYQDKESESYDPVSPSPWKLNRPVQAEEIGDRHPSTHFIGSRYCSSVDDANDVAYLQVTGPPEPEDMDGDGTPNATTWTFKVREWMKAKGLIGSDFSGTLPRLRDTFYAVGPQGDSNSSEGRMYGYFKDGTVLRRITLPALYEQIGHRIRVSCVAVTSVGDFLLLGGKKSGSGSTGNLFIVAEQIADTAARSITNDSFPFVREISLNGGDVIGGICADGDGDIIVTFPKTGQVGKWDLRLLLRGDLDPNTNSSIFGDDFGTPPRGSRKWICTLDKLEPARPLPLGCCVDLNNDIWIACAGTVTGDDTNGPYGAVYRLAQNRVEDLSEPLIMLAATLEWGCREIVADARGNIWVSQFGDYDDTIVGGGVGSGDGSRVFKLDYSGTVYGAGTIESLGTGPSIPLVRATATVSNAGETRCYVAMAKPITSHVFVCALNSQGNGNGRYDHRILCFKDASATALPDLDAPATRLPLQCMSAALSAKGDIWVFGGSGQLTLAYIDLSSYSGLPGVRAGNPASFVATAGGLKTELNISEQASSGNRFISVQEAAVAEFILNPRFSGDCGYAMANVVFPNYDFNADGTINRDHLRSDTPTAAW